MKFAGTLVRPVEREAVPLTRWKEFGHHWFSKLFVTAKDYVSIAATSAAAKHLFSTEGVFSAIKEGAERMIQWQVDLKWPVTRFVFSFAYFGELVACNISFVDANLYFHELYAFECGNYYRYFWIDVSSEGIIPAYESRHWRNQWAPQS